MKKKSRKELIISLAYCVEALASQSLMEGMGAINCALKCDEKIWDYIGDTARHTLGKGLSQFDPRETQTPDGSGRKE